MDGALVGVRSFKPGKKKGNFLWHEFFFPFNQAMNNLRGHGSYNILNLKKCNWWRSRNEIRPYTTINIYTLLNIFIKHKQIKKIFGWFPCISQTFEGSNKADFWLSTFTFVYGGKKFNNFNRWEKETSGQNEQFDRPEV